MLNLPGFLSVRLNAAASRFWYGPGWQAGAFTAFLWLSQLHPAPDDDGTIHAAAHHPLLTVLAVPGWRLPIWFCRPWPASTTIVPLRSEASWLQHPSGRRPPFTAIRRHGQRPVQLQVGYLDHRLRRASSRRVGCLFPAELDVISIGPTRVMRIANEVITTSWSARRAVLAAPIPVPSGDAGSGPVIRVLSISVFPQWSPVDHQRPL